MTYPTPTLLLQGSFDPTSAADLLLYLATCGHHGTRPEEWVVDAVLDRSEALVGPDALPAPVATRRWLERVEQLDLAAGTCARTPRLLAIGDKATALVDAACTCLPTGPAVEVARADAGRRGVAGLRPWRLLPEPPPLSILPSWLDGALGPQDHAHMLAAIRSDVAFRDAYRSAVLPRLRSVETAVVSPVWDPALCRDDQEVPVERVAVPHAAAGALSVYRTRRGLILELPDGVRHRFVDGVVEWQDEVLGAVRTELRVTRDAALDRRYGLTALDMVLEGTLTGVDADACVGALTADLRLGVMGELLAEVAFYASSAMRVPLQLPLATEEDRAPVLVPRVVPPVRDSHALADDGAGRVHPVPVSLPWSTAEMEPLTQRKDIPPAPSMEVLCEEWAWISLATRIGLQRLADEREDFDLLERLGEIDDLHHDDGPALYWVGDEPWRRLTNGLPLDSDAWWAWGAAVRGRTLTALRRKP